MKCKKCNSEMESINGDIDYNEYGQYMGFIEYECQECGEREIESISG